MRLRRQRSSEVFHVQSLAEVQAAFARAMTTGDAERLDAALVGGTSPRKRLAVHLRHYEASLTSALLEKFPACAWLVGGALVRAAARAYVRLHPPQQPCIAEYGREFPQFLGSYGGTAVLVGAAGFRRAGSAPRRDARAATGAALRALEVAHRRADDDLSARCGA
jgi:hypothetical protein